MLFGIADASQAQSIMSNAHLQRLCDDCWVSKQEWDALTKSEEAFMVNSYEIDILPGVWGDLDEPDQSRPVNELAGILLALIDRGWIEVRRLAPWTSPPGRTASSPVTWCLVISFRRFSKTRPTGSIPKMGTGLAR